MLTDGQTDGRTENRTPISYPATSKSDKNIQKPLPLEWIVRLVQGMYANARSCVRVSEGYSEEFEVKVSVHQGSVLSPLLFIIVPEATSQEFRSGVPWEDLYADDLVIIAESLNVSGGS